jgi:hypothetical protein
VLYGCNERQLDALALLITRGRGGESVLERNAGVWVGLEPDGLNERWGEFSPLCLAPNGSQLAFGCALLLARSGCEPGRRWRAAFGLSAFLASSGSAGFSVVRLARQGPRCANELFRVSPEQQPRAWSERKRRAQTDLGF